MQRVPSCSTRPQLCWCRNASGRQRSLKGRAGAGALSPRRSRLRSASGTRAAGCAGSELSPPSPSQHPLSAALGAFPQHSHNLRLLAPLLLPYPCRYQDREGPTELSGRCAWCRQCVCGSRLPEARGCNRRLSAATVSAEMDTYLNWLLQDPTADGAYKVFINIPLEPCYIIPHCSSPTPEPCGEGEYSGLGAAGCPIAPGWSSQRAGSQIPAFCTQRRRPGHGRSPQPRCAVLNARSNTLLGLRLPPHLISEPAAAFLLLVLGFAQPCLVRRGEGSTEAARGQPCRLGTALGCPRWQKNRGDGGTAAW